MESVEHSDKVDGLEQTRNSELPWRKHIKSFDFLPQPIQDSKDTEASGYHALVKQSLLDLSSKSDWTGQVQENTFLLVFTMELLHCFIMNRVDLQARMAASVFAISFLVWDSGPPQMIAITCPSSVTLTVLLGKSFTSTFARLTAMGMWIVASTCVSWTAKTIRDMGLHVLIQNKCHWFRMYLRDGITERVISRLPPLLWLPQATPRLWQANNLRVPQSGNQPMGSSLSFYSSCGHWMTQFQNFTFSSIFQTILAPSLALSSKGSKRHISMQEFCYSILWGSTYLKGKGKNNEVGKRSQGMMT